MLLAVLLAPVTSGVRAAPPEGPARDQGRLVALNSSLGMNCALLVDRLDGLRHAADMRRDDEG